MQPLSLIRFSPKCRNALSIARQATTGALVSAMMTGAAFAQTLPDVPVPADVQGGGSIHVIRWVIGVMILLSAAAIAGFGMLSVGSAALSKFRAWNSGARDVEIGDVISTVVMGLAILAVAILMCFGATQVIPSSIT